MEELSHRFIRVLVPFGVIICMIGGPAYAQSVGTEGHPYHTDHILPRPMVRSIIFGVGAGILVGFAAISDFKKNIRANIDMKSIARGASWGLYGGILLGLYLTYWVPDGSPEPQLENQPYDFPEQQEYQLPPQSGNRLHFKLETAFPEVEPVFNSAKFDGAVLKWRFSFL